MKGPWSGLYLILDLYGGKVVGFEVRYRDSADHAGHLERRTALAPPAAVELERLLDTLICRTWMYQCREVARWPRKIMWRAASSRWSVSPATA